MAWENANVAPLYQTMLEDMSIVTVGSSWTYFAGNNYAEALANYNGRFSGGMNLFDIPDNTYLFGEAGNGVIKYTSGVPKIEAAFQNTITAVTDGYNNVDQNISKPVFLINHASQQGLMLTANLWKGGAGYFVILSKEGYLGNNGYYNLYQLLTSHIIPLYTWHSLEGLYGNQLSLGLSQIKDEYIGDGSAVNLAPDTNIERLTQASRMDNIFANIGENFVPVSYAGDNPLKARVKYDENGFYQYEELAFFTADNDTTPIYSYHINTDYDKKYLQIIYDDEAEAARVSVIKDYLDNTCAYNQESFDQTTEHNLWLWLQGNQDGDSGDPYGEGSGDDGGDNFGLTPEDPLPFQSMPTASGLATGLFTVYNPTDTELQYLADFLWDPDAIGVLEKLFTEPENAIIAFYMLPVAPDHTGNKQLKLANANVPNCTGVKYLTDGNDGSGRYKEINFGSFSLKPKFDSYLDFNPYTTLKIYLPYIGVQNLNVDEFMCPAQASGAIGKTGYNNTFSLKYRIDLVTGVVSAFILRNNNVRYQFTGKCGMTLPITGRNYDNAISGILTAVAGVATTVASGGATAPMVAGASATAAGTVSAMKERVYHSGNLSGEASIFAYDTPYLIITRPNIPESTKDTKKFVGLPSYKTQNTLSSFSGFTKVFDAHIDNVSCTDEEKNEILQLLKEGVII